MQRSLSGIFFLIASIAFATALGSWWLEFNVLTPDTTVGSTQAILGDEEIRTEISTVVSVATAERLQRPLAEVAALVERVISSRPGAAVMTGIVHDAHQRALGMTDEPVRITGEQMVQIVRDERVAIVDPVTLPVAEITTLGFLQRWLGWFTVAMLAVGVLMLLLGFLARPEWPEVKLAAGELLIATAVSLVLFGYLVPTFVLPALGDTTWAGVSPRLAQRTLPLVLISAMVFGIVGGLIWVNARTGGRRGQWSASVPTQRYREDRRWSSPGRR